METVARLLALRSQGRSASAAPALYPAYHRLTVTCVRRRWDPTRRQGAPRSIRGVGESNSAGVQRTRCPAETTSNRAYRCAASMESFWTRKNQVQEQFVKRPQGERNVSDGIHASLGRRDFIVGISPCLIRAGRETGSASSVSPENPEEGALGRPAQQGGPSTVIKNTFAKGPEGWCSYEYHASVIARSEIFILAT